MQSDDTTTSPQQHVGSTVELGYARQKSVCKYCLGQCWHIGLAKVDMECEHCGGTGVHPNTELKDGHD